MNRAQRSEELSFAEDDSGYLKQRVGNCKLDNPEVGACLVLSRKSKGGQYGYSRIKHRESSRRTHHINPCMLEEFKFNTAMLFGQIH